MFGKSTERQGELYIIASALIWGFFPVLAILSYQKISPLISLTISTFISSFLFGAIVWWRHTFHQLKDTRALKDIFLMTLIIGVGYYTFYYLGLKYTSAGNGSIIASIEILFSYLFFNVWREEKMSTSHIWGAVFMLLGAGIILFPNFQHFKIGDILILIATALAPLGNFYQRRARTRVNSEIVWLVRSLIATPILFVIALLYGERLNIDGVVAVWPLLLINGLFVIGLSKIFWLESIHRINVAKANATSSICIAVTLLMSWIWLDQKPTLVQLSAILPMVLGLWLLSRQIKDGDLSSIPVSD